MEEIILNDSRNLNGFNLKTLCGTKTSVNRLLSKLLRPQSD